MKGEFKGIVKVACMYAATIIGAGFASGQEILQFFTSYYHGGFYGILTAGVLFSLIGLIVLDKVYSDRIRGYDEFLYPMTGWLLGWVIQIAVTLFMLSLFCVMTAGMATILANLLSIPFFMASALSSLICMAAILTDIKGIAALNTVVTPIMVLGMLAAGVYVILQHQEAVFNMNVYFMTITKNWFFSAIVYVSYNSLMSVVFMSGLLPYLKTRKTAVAGGALGGLILCFTAVILNTAISLFYPNLRGDLPVLGLMEKFSGLLSALYTAVLFVAMFVSSITAGYCVTERVGSKTGIPRRLTAVVISGLAVPLSTMGFSRLIGLLYPIFGYIGIFLVFLILFQGLRSLLPGKQRL